MALPTSIDGHEKRKFGRRNTLWHAWVIVPGCPRQACLVRNFSVAGALIEFPDRPPEAYQFRLVIDEFKFETLCDVRHRRDNMVGVFFPRAYAVAVTEKRPNGHEIVLGIREAMRAHS